MARLLIGAGGVASVAAHKLYKFDVFTEMMIASRTKSKCDDLKIIRSGH